MLNTCNVYTLLTGSIVDPQVLTGQIKYVITVIFFAGSFIGGWLHGGRYHPDKNTARPDAAEKFKEVAYSYSILCDPEKRERYDAAGFEVIVFLLSIF